MASICTYSCSWFRLWNGSYVTVGIIYETIGTKLIWQIFNNESIGLMRFLDLVYILITKILLVLFVYEITKTLKIDFRFQTLFFVIASLLSLSLLDYNLFSVDNISFREIPILIALITITKSLNKSSLIGFNFNSLERSNSCFFMQL